MTLAIETQSLRKLFGDAGAVHGLDLGIPRGIVYGLFGPNGAGKTTTTRVLATLLRPDGGSARVLGLFPVTMVSNIFVSPDTIPGWLQKIVAVNPVTHLADASRGLMHGNVQTSDVLRVLVAAAAVTAVFAPRSLRMDRRER